MDLYFFTKYAVMVIIPRIRNDEVIIGDAPKTILIAIYRKSSVINVNIRIFCLMYWVTFIGSISISIRNMVSWVMKLYIIMKGALSRNIIPLAPAIENAYNIAISMLLIGYAQKIFFIMFLSCLLYLSSM